jgi:hypothetical protein
LAARQCDEREYLELSGELVLSRRVQSGHGDGDSDGYSVASSSSSVYGDDAADGDDDL